MKVVKLHISERDWIFEFENKFYPFSAYLWEGEKQAIACEIAENPSSYGYVDEIKKDVVILSVEEINCK